MHFMVVQHCQLSLLLNWIIGLLILAERFLYQLLMLAMQQITRQILPILMQMQLGLLQQYQEITFLMVAILLLLIQVVLPPLHFHLKQPE